MSKNLLRSFLVGLILFFMITPAVFAQPTGPGSGAPFPIGGSGEPYPIGGSGQPIDLINPLGLQSIITLINKIIHYLIYLSIPFLALFILIGGFQILFARGSAEKVKAGRQTIQWAVIGFTIILVSKGVALILLQILS